MAFQRAGHPGFRETDFHAKDSQDRQQFAGAKFRHTAPLETGEGFRSNARLIRDRRLPDAKGLSAAGHRDAQLLEALHFDIYVKYLAESQII